MPTIRRATEGDAADMRRVERAAQSLLAEHGVDLDSLVVPAELEELTTWTLGVVAELHGRVVGMARLTGLTADLIALDQVSVDPDLGGQGVGRRLLNAVASEARDLGYKAITGTTFRDVAFNAPFYGRLGCTEDPQPHPTMVQRRRVESALGLDNFGPRVVMRMSLASAGST